MTWTKERIDHAVRLHTGGLSLAQVASEMRVTRNAVMGVIGRYHMTSPPARQDPSPPRRFSWELAA